MRDMNGEIYVTDIQENNVKVIYHLQGGKLEETAKIDSRYTVITMDKDYLYVQKNEKEAIKQIKINTPDKVEDGENSSVKNLSAFFEKYNTEDYTIQRYEYEKDNWYIYLMNWENDKNELYRIDKNGESKLVVDSAHMAWAGVKEGKVYVSLSGGDVSQNAEELYSIDEDGNRELYCRLSQMKGLEENAFDVHMGEWMEEGFMLLDEGPRSKIVIYDEKENKITYLSEWEKQQ